MKTIFNGQNTLTFSDGPMNYFLSQRELEAKCGTNTMFHIFVSDIDKIRIWQNRKCNFCKIYYRGFSYIIKTLEVKQNHFPRFLIVLIKGALLCNPNLKLYIGPVISVVKVSYILLAIALVSLFVFTVKNNSTPLIQLVNILLIAITIARLIILSSPVNIVKAEDFILKLKDK